jgi:NERD domain protein
MAMYYRTFNHSEGDRHREFEERWEKEWQEKLSQRLGMRNKEQHDLIEDLQEKIKKTDAYNDWIHWALEWKQQYDRYIGCLKIDIAKAHSYSNNQLKEAEETKIRRYKQILDTFHFLQSLYSDNITLLKKESKFRNDDFFRQYYSKVGRDADMTLTAYRNTEASQKITRLYIDNISRAQDILQLIKRASSEFYITNAGQKGEDAVEYVLKWLRPYGYMPVEKTCLTKYGTISILLQNKSFINEAQEYDHIIVGKNGVFLIETKNYSGEITITKDGDWFQNKGAESHGIKNPVQQCNRHAAIVKSIISDIPVTSIICIANDGVIIKGRSNCKIPIVKADLLQDFIEEYQTPVNLSKEEIEATLHTIDSYKVSEQLVLEEPKFIAPPQ